MRRWGTVLAAAVVLAAGIAGAQAPPRPTPKPGYVTPPENSAGLYPISGEPIFKARCAGCHDPAVDRAPTRAQLAGRSPEEVYDALTVGAMKTIGATLSPAELYGVTRFLTGKSPTPQTAQGPDPNVCASHGPLRPDGPRWNGWGRDLANSRYQPEPGFTAADIPRLKVKWAFSYPGTKNSQPVIFGDRVFVASLAGKLYALDTATGCVHWRFDFRGGARATMSLGPHKAAASGWALYLGDDRMFMRALDPGSGKVLWETRVGDHVVGRITGSPALWNGVLYVPLSASEESQGNVGAYGCCTFIGTVVAVNAADGRILWSRPILDQTPKPTRRNAAGTQMYGPAGGAIWSSPTIDARRGLVFVSTGDSYTEVSHPASDAVLALDAKTGAIRWVNQVLAEDNFMSGTVNGPLGERGPDFDFGSSPQLIRLGGRDILVTGNKSSIVYAMDPSTGKAVWTTPRLGMGSPAGGVEWSTATDGKIVYAPLADRAANGGRPGLVALDAATGRELWRVDAPVVTPCNVPSGLCRPGYSQAATAIPGAVFTGAQDGHLRAYSSAGRLLWDFDATVPHDTVNGVKGAPGGYLDMGGPTIAGGMMFMHTGYNGSAGASNVLLAFTPDGK